MGAELMTQRVILIWQRNKRHCSQNNKTEFTHTPPKHISKHIILLNPGTLRCMEKKTVSQRNNLEVSRRPHNWCQVPFYAHYPFVTIPAFPWGAAELSENFVLHHLLHRQGTQGSSFSPSWKRTIEELDEIDCTYWLDNQTSEFVTDLQP